MLKFNESIKAEGTIYWSDGKEVTNINYSDIFTELIQAVGNATEYYASDLYYDLKAIEECINNQIEKVIYIGIRCNGVDGTEFIRSRIDKNNINYYPNCYIKLYRVKIEISKHYQKNITVELERITEYKAEKELLNK